MKKWKEMLVGGWIFALLGVGSAAGSVFAPDLERFMGEAEAEEYVPVVVHFERGLDLDALTEGFSKGGVIVDRRTRHEVVVRALQDEARRTQRHIRALLARRQAEGSVASFQPFWIANAVAVEALPEVVNELAGLRDVRVISYDTPLEIVEPVKSEEAPESVLSGAESGLKEINAHLLWAQGFTGEGVLVSHLDTGVDGNHNALADRWRGLDPGVTPEEAFFDPVTSWTFPRDAGSHGTHTMGTIMGMTPGDTIGVAFGAKWISAAVIDRVSLEQTESDAVLAFQWSADPDGDPGTVDDVPVVSSNSWGFSPIYHGVPHCNDVFWDSMDGAEAAGVAVVFAAGNEGSGSKTLRTPADRITSSTNAYAIGALRPGSASIASFSSRGPSGCDDATIKPEVCAQGESVRSSVPGNSYSSYSGTSMAAPHVAGALALLNDINADILPARAKEILMETAVDLGSGGDDNTYGMGRVDLAAAGASVFAEMGGIYGAVATEGALVEGALVEEVETGKFALTDDVGEYALSVTPGDTYTIRASYYGFRQAEESVFVPQETFVEVNFDLDAATDGRLAGLVTDADSGDPVAGVTVEVMDTPLEPVLTGTDGRYAMGVSGGAVYDVAYSKVGYQNVVYEDVGIEEGGNTVVDVPLSPFPKILVWEPDETPGSGAFLEAYFRRRGEDVLVASELDTHGELNQFERVFVCLGMSPNNAVIEPGSPEDMALSSYLDGGDGRFLYLEGGDFWAFNAETSVRSYFNIAGISDGDGDLYQVDGVDGTPTRGRSYPYAGENQFVDDLAPLGTARAIWRNPADGWWAGVLYRSPLGYTTIGQSFEIGGLGAAAAASHMDFLMREALGK